MRFALTWLMHCALLSPANPLEATMSSPSVTRRANLVSISTDAAILAAYEDWLRATLDPRWDDPSFWSEEWQKALYQPVLDAEARMMALTPSTMQGLALQVLVINGFNAFLIEDAFKKLIEAAVVDLSEVLPVLCPEMSHAA
jgi:hypothetical protein